MYLMHVACDHDVEKFRCFCGPICGLGYLSNVHLILVINLGCVLSIFIWLSRVNFGLMQGLTFYI